MNLDDLVARVNSDLVGNLANLASRSAPMVRKKLEGRLGRLSAEGRELVALLQKEEAIISQAYEERRYAEVVRRICGLADDVNRYYDRRKPWGAIKDDPEHARETLTTGLNAVRILAIYLKPILPGFVAKIERMLGVAPLTWADVETVLEEHEIGEFERLVERVDPERVQAMVEDSKHCLLYTSDAADE